jgi:hypothetical protein
MPPLIDWIAIVVFCPNVSFREIKIIVFIQASLHSSGIALFMSMALVFPLCIFHSKILQFGLG